MLNPLQNAILVERFYRIIGFTFRIQAFDAELVPILDGLYPGYQIDEEVDTPVTYALIASNGGGNKRFSLIQNGRIRYSELPSIDALYAFLEWAVTKRALRHQQDFIQMHAGAVCKDGEAVLFPADSGAGKTTLVISCVLAGFDCLSDDVILVDSHSLETHPFPRLLHVREDTLHLFPHLKSQALFVLDRAGEVCYYMNREAIREGCSADISTPRAVVIPRYQPNSQTVLEAIGQTEAVSALMAQCINFARHGENGIHFLAELTKRVETYRLRYSNAIEAAELLAGKLPMGEGAKTGKRDKYISPTTYHGFC